MSDPKFGDSCSKCGGTLERRKDAFWTEFTGPRPGLKCSLCKFLWCDPENDFLEALKAEYQRRIDDEHNTKQEVQMGWDQQHTCATRLQLLEKILGISAEEMLKKEMAKRGLTITKEEDLNLQDTVCDFYGKAEKITISDGRVFQHKLSRSRSGDDWGIDYYDWFLEDETPVIRHEQMKYDDEDES